MKTIIFTISTALVLSVGSLFGQGKTQFYKNTIIENNKKTTTVYKGEDDKNLVPYKQITVSLNELGDIAERITYIWNVDTQSWNISNKYNYTYTDNKVISSVSYTTWNPNNKGWNTTSEFLVYKQNESNGNYTIDNLNKKSVIALK